MPEQQPSFHIREIVVPEGTKGVYQTDAVDDRLTNLSRLNVFIGPNNSGKSRFLRAIFSGQFLLGLRRPEADEARQLCNELHQSLQPVGEQLGRDFSRVRHLYPAPQNLRGDVPQQALDPVKETERLKADLTTIQVDSLERLGVNRREVVKKAGRLRDLLRGLRGKADKVQFYRVYVPTLRGLRIPKTDFNFYKDRTIEDFFGAPGDVGEPSGGADFPPIAQSHIITGLELCTAVRRQLLGSLSERRTIAEYQDFLGTQFFDGQAVALIPREGDKVLHVKIGKEKEQPVYHLGDGIQTAIILTFPLFLHRKANLLLFIEEPETHLHPGFQRKFIDVVTTHADSNWQVFVSTHSHQFLDITIDQQNCSVYRFAKVLKGDGDEEEPKFTIANWSNEDFSLLRELGVRNSSVLLSNCTIWVEGVTDRLYLRHFLSVFQKDKLRQFQEDLHFSFVEYSGANITHWSFLDDEPHPIDVERLCSRLFLVTDRDKGIRERHERLRQHLNERYYCLECREIENLLAPSVIRKVIQQYEENATDLNEWTEGEQRDVSLGQFIEERVLADRVRASGQSRTATRMRQRAARSKTSRASATVPFAKLRAERISPPRRSGCANGCMHSSNLKTRRARPTTTCFSERRPVSEFRSTRT